LDFIKDWPKFLEKKLKGSKNFNLLGQLCSKDHVNIKKESVEKDIIYG
jgi:hypothetical protein